MRLNNVNDTYSNVEDFNPRTPYGMRQLEVEKAKLREEFQSTHPLRDATIVDFAVFHSPIQFQSTHPLRDATSYVLPINTGISISIHAPLTGCDETSIIPLTSEQQFQSTHPLRDATVPMEKVKVTYDISIHAPLTGCDKGLRRTMMMY